MPTVVGQERGAVATVMRDFVDADQEWEFPRGRINKKLFLDEQWDINKPSFVEENLKFDCCNIKKGGERKSIDCAFNRVYEAVPLRGDFIGAPHGGTTGSFRVRQNGFNTRRVTGKR